MNLYTVRQFLDYELGASAWWVSLISNEWLQDRVGTYFARKVQRKYRRYITYLAMSRAIEYAKTQVEIKT